MVAVGLGTAGVAQADTPTDQTLPSLVPSGTVTVGSPITLTQGTWNPSTPTSSLTDVWTSCSSPQSCTTITPEVSGTGVMSYTPTATDVGNTIEVAETATNTADSPATPASSAQNSNSVTVVPQVPTVITAPAISGVAVENETLTETGAWSNSPTGYTYQWEDCDATGAACADIPTATGSTYVVTAGDVGHTVRLIVSASNAGGSSTPSTSNPTAVVAAAANATLPAPAGSPVEGQTLTASTGTWDFTPTSYTYAWLRCATAGSCASISGATSASYQLTSADVDDTIEATVIATDGTVSATATSVATAKIQPPAPSNSAAPGVSGTAQTGHTLTEVPGHWSTDPAFPTTVVVTWYECLSDGSGCRAIATGAQGSQYTLTTGDIGATFQVVETATNATGHNIAYSALSDPVTNAAGVVPVPALTSAGPQVSGAASFGSTLTATRVAFNGNPGTYGFQWQRCSPTGCLDIPGATSLSYAVTAADVGYALHIVESAVNSGGASSLAQSANTARVTAPSTTILQRSVGDPVAGQSVSLIAAVASPASSLEAGTLTFSAHGKAIRGCAGLALPAVPTQPVLCHARFAASRHAVVATFTPDPGTYVTGSASPATALTVRQVPTTITLGTSARILLGKRVTYRATVQPGSSGSLRPAGRVTFLDGTKPIAGCDRVRLRGAAAACTVRYLSLRTHTISIRYAGNRDFAAARSAGRRVPVAAQSPSGVVNAFMSWTFAYGPAATQVRTLSVSGLAAGTRISMVCSGGGCAFHHYVKTISVPARCRAHHRCRGISLNLTPTFDHHSLDVGAHLTVMLSHPGWLGKYYLFTIRHGRKPALRESCLAVGGIRPSVGCTAAA